MFTNSFHNEFLGTVPATSTKVSLISSNNQPSWFSLQGLPVGPTVIRGRGFPNVRKGHLLMRMLSSSVCTADSRVATGLKSVGGFNRYNQLGHEGVGIIVSADEAYQRLIGKLAVFMPHIRPKDHDCVHCRKGKQYQCQHSVHGGFEVDGTFGDFLVTPVQNVKIIPEEVITAAKVAESQTARPWPAILSLIEPWSCIKTGVAIMQDMDIEAMNGRLSQKLQFKNGNALLVGCGVMSGMWSIALNQLGWQVAIYDTDNLRAELLYRQLKGNPRIFVPDQDPTAFDLIVVNTSSGAAAARAFDHVANHGLIYFFSGINNAKEENITSPQKIINIEPLHRSGSIALQQLHDGRWVFMAGHSGYSNNAFEDAVQSIGHHAFDFAPLITGLVDGFAGDTVKSLLNEVKDYKTPGTPVLPAILKGEWGHIKQQHLKISIIAETAALFEEQNKNGAH